MTPVHWDVESLWQQLEPQLPGLTLEVAASVGSTNTVLLDRIRAGDTQPSLLVAESQTQGRGRLGRQWQSAPGASLTFSLALPLLTPDWSGLSLAVGLALAEALDPLGAPEREQSPQIVLKWPNDLMLDLPGCPTRKLGGILIESLATSGQRMAVIGMGLNITEHFNAPDNASVAPGGLPPQGVGALQELLPHITAPQALARVSAPLLGMLRAFEAHGFAPLRARYARRDALAGQPVTTTLPHLPGGIADGVDDDGALRLRVDTALHRVVSGEVSVRAPHFNAKEIRS